MPWNRILLITALTLAALTVSAAEENLAVKTAHFTLDFEKGIDGRVYQRTLGRNGSGKGGAKRDQEAYPQAGDGYIWEPALEIAHADGNTSTALLFESVTRSNSAAGQ